MTSMQFFRLVIFIVFFSSGFIRHFAFASDCKFQVSYMIFPYGNGLESPQSIEKWTAFPETIAFESNVFVRVKIEGVPVKPQEDLKFQWKFEPKDVQAEVPLLFGSLPLKRINEHHVQSDGWSLNIKVIADLPDKPGMLLWSITQNGTEVCQKTTEVVGID
ncbi:MAG: hypothetical protein KDD61_09500 [Bdellovibrionales bacterium]|nr:hypothetical protein [Bdellovibrionales bacterium]